MRMRAYEFWILVVVLVCIGGVATDATEAVPAWTEAQIEEDWLIQARMSPENLRALARLDAARIIDGVESGQPEQQTLLERWAWWEVDLGAEVALDRIEIHNPRPNRDKGVAFKVTIGPTREEHRQVHFMRGPEWTNSHLVGNFMRRLSGSVTLDRSPYSSFRQ